MAEEAKEEPLASPEQAAAKPNDAEAPAPPTTGSRKRKQTDFFAPSDLKSPEKLVIQEGKGQKFGDIPNVAFHFSKVTGRDEVLEALHRVLFKTPGKLMTRKRDILGFSGLVYKGDAEEERAKVADKLSKWKLEEVNRTLDLLDIPRGSGSKDEKITALMDFLEEPKAMREVDLAEKAAKEKEKKDKAKAKKEKAEAKQEEKKEPPAKKNTKAKKAEPAKAEPPAKKRKAPAKPAAKKKKVEEPEEEEDDSEDEAPLAAVAAAPSDEALRAEVLAILGTVKLEDFSLKDLLRRLEEKYKLSFRKRKEFVKEVVSKFISERDAEGGGEAEAPAEQQGAEEGNEKKEDGHDEDVGEAAHDAEEQPAAEEAMGEDAPAAEEKPPAAEEKPAEAAATAPDEADTATAAE